MASPKTSPDAMRLEALIRRNVGWQIEDLEVYVDEGRIVLEGHAKCAFARRLAEDEAVRLTGLPVDNRMLLD